MNKCEIVQPGKSQMKEIEHVLGKAFADNPFGDVFGGNAEYLGAFLGMLARTAMKDGDTVVLGMTDGGALSAVALYVRGTWKPKGPSALPGLVRLFLKLPWRIFRHSLALMKQLDEGMKNVSKFDDEMELLLLAVNPEAQGKGIGRALLERGDEIAKDRGLEKIRLEVVAETPAVGFYEKLGFDCEGEISSGKFKIRIMRRRV